MRLLICAGGTGGGVYPALAVLENLLKEREDMSVLWVGGEGGMEVSLVEKAALPFKSIPAAGLHGVGIHHVPSNLLKVARGYSESRRILREYQPDVLFFTGGFVAVPMALAGRKIPSVLFVPDIEPGLAIKSIAKFTNKIATTTDDTSKFFKDKRRLVKTGYPTRDSISGWSRVLARKKMQLTDHLPVLVVVGGSKGARSINKSVIAHLPDLLEMVQVVHISGELDWLEVEKKAAETNHPGYHAYPYLHEDMGAALASADLVLSRAGASTLGEYPLFGLPSILVPYPYAWRYQKVNSDYLVERNAAVLIEDSKLDRDLIQVVKKLLSEPTCLSSMRKAARSLATPDAAASIGKLLIDLVER